MDKPYHRPVPVPAKPLPTTSPPTRDDIRRQLGWDMIQRRREGYAR